MSWFAETYQHTEIDNLQIRTVDMYFLEILPPFHIQRRDGITKMCSRAKHILHFNPETKPRRFSKWFNYRYKFCYQVAN